MSEVKRWDLERGSRVEEAQDGEFVYAYELDDVLAQVARLSALVPRWVPVGERLPPQGVFKSVLICGRDCDDRLRCTQFGDWFDSDGCGHKSVTHWLEVPIPPLPGTETP